MKITHYGNVDAKRSDVAPSVQRQLDMLWQALGELQSNGVITFSPEVRAMGEVIKAVQQKFPDPPKGSA